MIFPNLQQFDYFAYDTETTGLRYKVDTVFGFSISTPDGQNYYYDVRETPKAVDWLNDSARVYDGTIICHNASFDYRMSDHSGIYLPLEQLDDTVTRACLIDEHLFAYDLDSLGKKYLGVGKYGDIYRELADIFGGRATRNVQMPNLWKAPSKLVAPYAKADTRTTLDLWEWQRGEITRQNLHDIVAFELEVMPALIRAEIRGIRVDLDYAQMAFDKLTPFLVEQQGIINKIAGEEVNVNSSPQIKAIFNPIEVADGLWTASDGTPIGTTPKGGPSINAEILRGMDTPLSNAIIDLRSLIKTRDTFLGKHVMEHAIGDYVYPTINQNKGEDGGTGTGRLSITGPALQQIPTRNKETAAIIKPCFLPPEGMVWTDCDESSFEVRCFADLIGNQQIVNAYQSNPLLDLHQYVADLTGLPRGASYAGQPNAKQLNLSMIFNSGNGAIADKMGMAWEWNEFTARNGDKIRYKKAGKEAEEVIARYHKRITGVRELANRDKKIAENQGFLTTYFGRKLRFPRGYKSYKASGLRIQATAADLNKENWLLIEEQLGKDGEFGHLLLNTHDSYSLALPEDWKPHYNRIKKALEEEGRLKVPLILDWSGTGHNWQQALQGKDYASKRRRHNSV